MCNRVLLLFGKMPQWNLYVNCNVNLKLYSNPPGWLAKSHCHMGTFWKTKDWSSNFWESQPFRFWYVEVHCYVEDINRRKQVFLLNFRPWPAQKRNIWSIFYGKKVISENSKVWKLGAFGLKIGTFHRLLVVASYPCRIGTLSRSLSSSGWHVTSEA